MFGSKGDEKCINPAGEGGGGVRGLTRSVFAVYLHQFKKEGEAGGAGDSLLLLLLITGAFIVDIYRHVIHPIQAFAGATSKIYSVGEEAHKKLAQAGALTGNVVVR